MRICRSAGWASAVDPLGGIKHYMRLALLVITMTSPLVFAQTEDPKRTGQMTNGRVWTDFSREQKIAYIFAVFDASHYDALVGTAAKQPNTRSQFKLTTSFSVADYIQKMDTLYSDAANILLPLPFAVQYCSTDLAGEKTKQELESWLIEIRKLAKALTK